MKSIKSIRAGISFSDETHVWDTLTSLFYAVHPRITGYELLPSLASTRKVIFDSAVSFK